MVDAGLLVMTFGMNVSNQVETRSLSSGTHVEFRPHETRPLPAVSPSGLPYIINSPSLFGLLMRQTVSPKAGGVSGVMVFPFRVMGVRA